MSRLILPLPASRVACGRRCGGRTGARRGRCAVLAAQGWETGTDGLRPIPPLSAHVTDLTQTLSAAEKGALEAKLADWEARTTNQLAVLVVPTTQPEPIEAYSLRVAEKWKIGRKGHDNGALLTVAKDDRKMRIEVGYGLEGTLTDATTRRIIAENIAPYFREGRFAAGIGAGVDRIIEVVGEGKPLPPSGVAEGAARRARFRFRHGAPPAPHRRSVDRPRSCGAFSDDSWDRRSARASSAP